ncbi:MAG: transcription antitermination factor NusB [Rhodospirillales bacterium]
MPETGGKKKKQDGRQRSVARLAAVQALYERAIRHAEASDILAEFHSQRWLGADEENTEPLAKPDVGFMGDLVRGVSEKQDDLELMIGSALDDGNDFKRYEVLLQTILLAAAYELFARPDVPPRVVINEYLDVAHAFFADKEAALVNGVLDKLARKLRPQEMAARAGA